jgi:hypothetical protein
VIGKPGYSKKEARLAGEDWCRGNSLNSGFRGAKSMFTIKKRVSLAVVAVATVGLLGHDAQAQTTLRPGFRVNPSMTPQQALISQAILNQGLTGGVNPALNPLLNPALAGALNPYAGVLNAYGAGSLTSNPYGGGDLNAYPGASPYGGYYESPVGGYLRGTADIITAQGKWQMDTQRAYLLREQWRREKVETRKRIFDQYLYEREKTPTFEEERQRFLQQELARSLNSPPMVEVWSGQALNTVLSDLAKTDEKKLASRAPKIPLDEDVLKHLNLTSGGGGNAGLLRNEGQLSWPPTLRGDEYKPERELLSTLAPEAIKQAIGGKVDSSILRDMGNAVDRMQQKLAANIKDLSPNQYADARRFLGYFEDAMRILGRPDAGDYFSKKFVPTSKDVGELVKFMTSKGLSFAPAVPGDEAAYVAVHRALVAYDSAVKTLVANER